MKNNYFIRKRLLPLIFSVCVFYMQFAQIPANTRFFQPTKTYGIFNNGFLHHLNSAKNEIYLSVSASSGSSSFFGNYYLGKTRFVSRIAQDGLPVWTAKLENESGNDYLFNARPDFASVDSNDNIIVSCISSNSVSVLTDGVGNTENITNDNPDNPIRIIFKLDKNGNKIWTKKIVNNGYASLITDSNGDVYVVGQNGILDNISLGNTFLVKLDGTNGQIIFSKSYNFSAYQFIPVFDAQNNLYIFTEPITSQNSLSIDNLNIPIDGENGLNSIMLKYDNSGNAIWGKNFYTDNSQLSYSWMDDAVFDGSNFIVSGNLYKDPEVSYYLGLDNFKFVPKYPNTYYEGLIAKIGLDGNVVWQKIIESSANLSTGFYTNIELDDAKNIYSYIGIKDKLTFDNSEYQFDSNNGNRVITKFNNDGNLLYYNAVDAVNIIGDARGFMIDVFGNDQYNCSGLTYQNNFLNYNITNTSNPKFYVATFGNLDGKYLTPESNYLLLTNIAISNNPDNANTFSFDLINNVNWSATSDQSWLSVSSQSLVGRNATNSVSGTGDAKITLTAETNNTGNDRSANVLINGDGGVASKTVTVTQSKMLATQEVKTFVTVIYPNPASDILNIRTEQQISGIEIYDTSGKLLKSKAGFDKQLRISDLPKGSYILRIYTSSGIVNSKFIKN